MNTPASTRRSSSRLLVAALAFAAILISAFSVASIAAAAKPSKDFDIGFADYLYEIDESSDKEMKLTQTVNADVIRVNMPWNYVASGAEPANPRDPADPAYNWKGYDTAIKSAEKYGFDVDLTIFWAPPWAEGPNRPDDFGKYPPGSWKPDADKFGDFAAAVAERYSGSYQADGETLPQVKYFEAWNEPNLSTYITPQWDGKNNLATDIYAKLLDAFYEEIKAVNPTSKVVSGGTAPYGDVRPRAASPEPHPPAALQAGDALPEPPQQEDALPQRRLASTVRHLRPPPDQPARSPRGQGRQQG